MGKEDFLTTLPAARRVGIGPERLRQLERAGRISAIRTSSGLRLFRQADVERLAAERAAKRDKAGEPMKP